MFTGLIQQIGTFVRHETITSGLRLVIKSAAWQPPLKLGESLAVNGACLTIAQIQGRSFSCDLLQETTSRTNLGKKRPGAPLNLERALRLDDALGGHLITGHVDGTGIVKSCQACGRDRILRVSCAADLLRGLVPKGGIAIDGVSLTVVELMEGHFSVALIPFTREHTTLGQLRAGESVNLETDLIGKHVRRYLETAPSAARLTWEQLRSAGFGES